MTAGAWGMGTSVADLEIFRGGFSFTKTPAKLEVKTKKKGLQLFQSSFSSKFTGPTDNDLKWTKIPYVTYGTDLSQ